MVVRLDINIVRNLDNSHVLRPSNHYEVRVCGGRMWSVHARAATSEFASPVFVTMCMWAFFCNLFSAENKHQIRWSKAQENSNGDLWSALGMKGCARWGVFSSIRDSRGAEVWFDACCLLKFDVYSKIVNVPVHGVTKTRVAKVPMSTVRRCAAHWVIARSRCMRMTVPCCISELQTAEIITISFFFSFFNCWPSECMSLPRCVYSKGTY